ncbi:MAG: TolC family protein [Pirellulales bacterium]|nr:TolC family protein [Pirellulales bacterium]
MDCRGSDLQHHWGLAGCWRVQVHWIVSLTIGVLVCGCKVGPDYCGPPSAPVGAYYPVANEGNEAGPSAPQKPEGEVLLRKPREDTGGETPSPDALAPELVSWWTSLNDPVLNELVVCAVRNNRDLRVAAERIFKARASRGTVVSSLFPQVDTDGSFTREKRASGGFLGGVARDWWAWGTRMTWEIDVFGRLRRLLEAADADVGEQQELYRDTLVLLIAETATAYAEARSHQEQMAIVAANINVQAKTVHLVRSRFDNEKADMLDVSQSEGSLKGVEAGYPATQILYRESINRLSVLLGSPPGAVDALMRQPRPIPHAPEYVATGIPADLLRRRPDIRAAERRVAAQTARIGAAVGELYPQFSLVGAFGLESQNFSTLWNANAITASVAPGMQWHILNFGRYRSNIWVQESMQRQYLWEYENTVLQAAEEVDNALVGFVQGKQRGKLLQESVDYYREAVRLSQIKYRAGNVDLQRVLDSQSSLLASQNQLLLNRMAVVRSFISLYRALGGGWQLPVEQVTPLPPVVAENQPEVVPAPLPGARP